MEENMGLPLLGDTFPEMEVDTTEGTLMLPSQFEGKWFILFSHPADFTPVCTTEFVSFARNYEKFQELNTELIGLSMDQVFSHIKWIEWIEENLEQEIQFPIIGDHLGLVAENLGMIHPGKGLNTVRAVFIVDDKATVRTILYYPQEVGRNISEILRTVKALQKSNEGVATPANWPNNELIKDKTIIPPAKDRKTVEERKNSDEYECYDWWFCYK